MNFEADNALSRLRAAQTVWFLSAGEPNPFETSILQRALYYDQSSYVGDGGRVLPAFTSEDSARQYQEKIRDAIPTGPLVSCSPGELQSLVVELIRRGQTDPPVYLTIDPQPWQPIIPQRLDKVLGVLTGSDGENEDRDA